ncbi:hypothetical protein Angca_000206 [Angiostrongylus cantonensis]|nr:hypothetical protein Angca_000206 [Angiostrongylus cantonensis]
MPEDPDLSKRRIEHQQLRKQLNEVFGPFEQFCEYVAGTASAGSSGIMRHGVVQIPTTSGELSTHSVMPTSGQASVTTTQHSTQQLLQSMQNLVASPIRPIQGLSFSFNQDCHTSEASSTHSAPEASSNLVKGKRHRMQDSDTEVERDKRKRRDEDVMLYAFPIQVRSNTRTLSTSDGHRTAFRDGAERKELMDKGISPDSGVHSAENDPGDDNDIHSAQTIINIITKLSPPLSPIKKPPSDKKAERERKEIEIKERQRKDKDRKEKERAYSIKREREVEQKPREQKEYEQQLRREKEREVSRLDGEIILKGLDRSRLSQLIEIGRKMGRTKCMPHASISQSHDGSDQTHFRSSSTMGNHPSRIGFECAAAESAPTKPARPVKPKEDSTEMLYDFYQSVAKSQKRKGDVETDKVNKVLFYLDTAVYFILSARHVSSDSPENRGNRQYSIIRDTNDLLKTKLS